MIIDKIARGEAVQEGELADFRRRIEELERSSSFLRAHILGSPGDFQTDNLLVRGDLDVGGGAEIGESLYVYGVLDIVGAFSTGGNAGFGASINVVADATVNGTMSLKERAAAKDDTAAYGQLWVKTAAPCELWFTDDDGTDTQIV